MWRGDLVIFHTGALAHTDSGRTGMDRLAAMFGRGQGCGRAWHTLVLAQTENGLGVRGEDLVIFHPGIATKKWTVK
jgi:hypothetical protein